LPVAVSRSCPTIHFLDRGDILIAQLVALRRHLRIFRLLDALEELARARIAGLQHLPVLTALQRAV
jgi:hypothetical protein